MPTVIVSNIEFPSFTRKSILNPSGFLTFTPSIQEQRKNLLDQAYMPEFIHLHNHTHYSLLDGACSVDGLIQVAGENKMAAVGLTDHGVNFGLLEFYQKSKKAGIKPILGCEVYVADGDRFDKSSLKADGKQKRRNYFHLILLAKNYDGYRTLNKLTSRAHTEGFYYKPRIDRQLLEENHNGLICLSACAGGVVSAHLVNENMDAAREAAIWYRELFGQDFYLEIQNHGIPVDRPVLEGMPILSKELGIPLVATNDCHYIRKEHAIAHNVLLHVRDASSKGEALNVEDELRYGTTNFYFKSAEEMAELFREFPDAIERTVEIAEKCDLKIPNELHMPDFPIPEVSKAENLDDYLKELTWSGVEKRYHNIPAEVTERVNFELDVITRMGYSGYFLIVQDFIQAARDRGVRVGPGRGSAAGSLVAYALRITDIDPLKYDLLFERFLNPDRVSMPDIDVDFADNKREEVIEYVKRQYGEEAVSQIITFSTLSARAVLKDVGRVLGIPHTTINEITKDIQVKFGRVQKLSEALENPELRWVKESTDQKIKKLIDYSLVLEGFCRAASTHAAGVVIAPGPLEEYIPLYKTPTTGLASQYTMKYLEDAGLLKMDFLGLRTLTIIEDALELIRNRHGIDLDIDAIPLDDPKTYEMLGKGLTTAVFQFESPPMQKYLKQLKPERLDDLIAMNALYRPGPMDNIPDFIDRKHGRKEIAYLHDKLEPILGTTYGICVTGDTEVFDALYGKRFRIDQLEEHCGNFLIQGVDENLEASFAQVSHFYNNGVKPVVQVRLRNGATARMTRDHKVLTEKGWREIGSLKAGDFIATPRSLNVLAPQNYSPERLRILAYLIADGSLTSGSSTDFVSKDNRMIAEYKRCLLATFQNIETVDLTQIRGVTRVQVRGTNKSSYHQPNELLSWMRELGLKSTRGGTDSRAKFIPDFVFGLNTDDIAFFIASLWDCDGHVGERSCHYKTISKRLARDVQTLLLRIGISADIYESEYFSPRRNANVTAYQVTLYNLPAFAELVGEHLIAKSIDVAGQSSYRSQSDTLSREIFIEELERAWNGSWRGLMAEHGISRQHFVPKGRKRSRIPTEIATALLPALELPCTSANANVLWERIEAIEDAGEELVYDITVEGIHNFVGNNIILHNCVYQEQIMQIAQQLGGFTLAQADSLRRAMGKKQIQLMDEMKGTYFEGCKAQEIERKTADEIWDMMVKFADYGFNKCLPGDVEVIDGSTGKPVRIEDLYSAGVKGFSTLTCDTDRLQIRTGAVSQVMFNGIKPVFKLTTRSGREIQATANHPFYTHEGWKRLDELHSGELIATPRSLPIEGSAEWPDNEVIALGHLLAEGNLCHPASVYYYTQDNDQLADYIQAAESFANVRCRVAVHHSTWSVYAKRIDKKSEAGIVTWAKQLGIWGKNALQKEIPSEAFTLGNRQIGLLISRMWEGDGHIDLAGRSLFYATSSKRMAHQLQHLLLRLGILSRIRSVDFPYRGMLKRGYQVFITGAEQIAKFKEKIAEHFVSTNRRTLLEDILEEASDTYAVIDVIPVAAREHVRRIKVERGLTWSEFEKLAAVSSRDFYPTGTNPNKKGFTRKTFAKISEAFNDSDIARLAGSDIYWDEIVCIEYQGEKPTYDLEVPGTHNFVANDILVHNSHSAAYAYIAYQTAYLKANYPAEYLAANMTNEASDQTKVVKLIDECRAFNANVLPPDINRSMVNFSVDNNGQIVFGMAAIRNVGASAVSAILEERQRDGLFSSIFDFTKRLAGNSLINKRLLEHLVLAGAFDSVHPNRQQCYLAIDSAVGYGGAWATQRASGMDSLFAMEGGIGEEAMIPAPSLPNVPEWSQLEKLKREKEVLDFYVSGHPLEGYRLEAETFSEIKFGELPEEIEANRPARICGVVSYVRTKLDRRENQFAIVGIEDFTGKAECVFWSESWRRNAAMVTEGAMIFVIGRPEIEGADKLRIIADEVVPVSEALQKFTKGVAINVRLENVEEDAPQRTEALFKEHQGEVQCVFRVYDTQGALVGRWAARKAMVSPSRELIDGLGRIYSPQNVRIVG